MIVNPETSEQYNATWYLLWTLTKLTKFSPVVLEAYDAFTTGSDKYCPGCSSKFEGDDDWCECDDDEDHEAEWDEDEEDEDEFDTSEQPDETGAV